MLTMKGQYTLNMITTILSDFSRVILNPKDSTYPGSLNGLYKELIARGKEFNFDDYYVFNDELLEIYEELKQKYSMNIFTSGSIQKNSSEVRARIDPIFENIFTAQDYELNKEDPHAYLFIAEKLGVKPEEILYIDDLRENVDAAAKANLVAMQFITNGELKTVIREILL